MKSDNIIKCSLTLLDHSSSLDSPENIKCYTSQSLQDKKKKKKVSKITSVGNEKNENASGQTKIFDQTKGNEYIDGLLTYKKALQKQAYSEVII